MGKSMNILNRVHVILMYLIISILILAGCGEKTITIKPQDTISQNSSKDIKSEAIASIPEVNLKNAKQQNINEFSFILDKGSLSLTLLSIFQ